MPERAANRSAEIKPRYQERNGAPEEIRTPDPQIRSLVLYPAELRVRGRNGRNRWRGRFSKASLEGMQVDF